MVPTSQIQEPDSTRKPNHPEKATGFPADSLSPPRGQWFLDQSSYLAQFCAGEKMVPVFISFQSLVVAKSSGTSARQPPGRHTLRCLLIPGDKVKHEPLRPAAMAGCRRQRPPWSCMATSRGRATARLSANEKFLVAKGEKKDAEVLLFDLG